MRKPARVIYREDLTNEEWDYLKKLKTFPGIEAYVDQYLYDKHRKEAVDDEESRQEPKM